jgi:hypothetical protein
MTFRKEIAQFDVVALLNEVMNATDAFKMEQENTRIQINLEKFLGKWTITIEEQKER